MKLIPCLVLGLVGPPVVAQTTYNLSPFNSQADCLAAAQKVGTGFVCGTTFTTKPVVVTPTVKLSGVPAVGDTTGKASISYTLTGTAKVWCRRDTYAPILCPNPFVLGATTPLVAGSHTVDYYLVVGTASPDMAKVAASATWTVAAPTLPPSTATPLPALPDSAGSCASVVTAPGSGKPINLHRITSTQGQEWGGERCETFYNSGAYDMPDGTRWCGAFAAGMKAGEAVIPTSFDSSMVVMQTHSAGAGDTNPPFALVASGYNGDPKAPNGSLMWNVSYQDDPTVDANGWQKAKENRTVHTEPLMAPGVIYRYVWDVTLQWNVNAIPSPFVTVWRAKPGAAYEKLFTWTGPNDYNLLNNIWKGDVYPRIGPYKWSSWASGQTSIAWYLTPLYFGKSNDCLAAGAAALQGY